MLAMMAPLDLLRTAAALVFVFGLVIFVHELGHFLAAKAFGVYAPRFSIGFGPALWKRRWGETEYVIAALPLGGYVRMASREDETLAMLEGGGEHPREAPATVGGSGTEVAPVPPTGNDAFDPEAMAPFGPRPVPEDRLLESKSLGARLTILLAGVTMNVLLGVVITTGLLLWKGDVVIRTRVVGSVERVAGLSDAVLRLHAGDTILAINGHPVATWNDISDAIDTAAGPTLDVRTSAGAVSLPVVGEAERDRLQAAIQPYVAPVIGDVSPSTPAAEAGLLPGDSIVAVNDTSVASWSQVVDHIRGSPGTPVHLSIVRDGARRDLSVRPDSTQIRDPASGERIVIGMIGAAARIGDERRPVPFGQAVSQGWSATWAFAGTIFSAVREMASGQSSLRNLGGPVAIAQATASAARVGIERVLLLTALLSVNLAVFNLLPIPILDGGQILITLVEGIRGSALSPRTREMVIRVGLVFIVLLFVFVTINDLGRVFHSIRDFLNRLLGT